MTVVLLSMAGLAAVVLIAVFASRFDKGARDDDPDLRPDEKRSVAATTAALGAVAQKDRQEH